MANRNGAKYGFTALFPIGPGEHGAQLREYLRSLDGHRRGSPLSELQVVHMARLVIIDRLAYESFPAHADHLKMAYLLFMCDFDERDLVPLVNAMVRKIPGVAKDIWGHCLQFPGTDDADRLLTYFQKCQLKTNLFLADRPDDTVDQILRALRLRRKFGGFVVGAQQRSPAAADLQRAFLRMWQQLENSPAPEPGSL